VRHDGAMKLWLANAIGLALGFALSGAALAMLLPGPDAPLAPPPQPSVSQSAEPEKASPAPISTMLPVEPRSIAMPPPASPLPNIIHPEARPNGTAHKPGTGMAGTAFFVASDGSLLTAAHIVSGCRQTRIASQFVHQMAAQVIAMDEKQDIALLRAAVAPPAVLAIGGPAAPGGQLFVLGYPGSGGPLIATETWAVLENTAFQPGPAELVDPGRVIWAAAPEVVRGFSGGPMLDPRNGEVVGIVRGMVDSARLHAVRSTIPASGMVVGPGSSALMTLLRQEGTDDDALPVSGDDALDAARRATVHVLCLY
jgi:S1-C subfamily serine protease